MSLLVIIVDDEPLARRRLRRLLKLHDDVDDVPHPDTFAFVQNQRLLVKRHDRGEKEFPLAGEDILALGHLCGALRVIHPSPRTKMLRVLGLVCCGRPIRSEVGGVSRAVTATSGPPPSPRPQPAPRTGRSSP